MTSEVATREVAWDEGHFRFAVEAARRGDEAAFRQIYEQYAPSVYNLVLRSVRNKQTAEDICQEVWLKAHRELHRLAEPQAFPAWLYRIASRACVDAARKKSRVPIPVELPEERTQAAGDDPERSALRRERARLTWEAMGVLPARQHIALFLKEIERRSYKEIAQMLETSEPAVETLLFRARQSFAKAYERLEAAMQDRCHHAQRAMAAVMDGEATRVQETALRAHVESCRSCFGELGRMRRASAAYAALAPLPVPAVLGERIFGSLGATGASAAPTGVAKILAVAGAKVKLGSLALVATTATTAVTVGSHSSALIEDAGMPPPVSQSAEVGPGVDSWPGAAVEDRAIAPVDGPVAETHEDAISRLGTGSEITPPEAEQLVNGVISDVTTDAGGAAAGLTGTVDALVHETKAAVDGELPIAPDVVEAEISPLPVVPSVTPTAVPEMPPVP